MSADLPDWLKPKPPDPPKPKPVAKQPSIPVSDFEQARQSRYVAAALAKACEAIRAAEEGTRNDTLNKEALGIFRLVRGGHLDADAAHEAMEQAARDVGLTADETRRTLQSACRAAAKDPRVDLHMGERREQEELPELEIGSAGHSPRQSKHRLTLQRASEIEPRRTVWLWQERIALGALALLAGREGTGKSTLAYGLAAQITKGDIAGEHKGSPRAVLIAATEDSWAHTIVPRLIAADADLDLVYRIEVRDELADISLGGLRLPRDNAELERAIDQTGAVLLLFDPLLSTISEGLDTHRDSEVRQALEPVVAIADRTGLSILGVMHFNKSGSTDPLQLVMASKAFTAVARSVSTVVPDPEDDTGRRRLFGTPKNNLGRSDLPTLAFEIEGVTLPVSDGTTVTGRIKWLGESRTTIADALDSGAHSSDDRTAIKDAADWLADYMEVNGGRAQSKDVKDAGRKEGHSESTLGRARKRLRLTIESHGMPRRTYWVSPPPAPDSSSRVNALGRDI